MKREEIRHVRLQRGCAEGGHLLFQTTQIENFPSETHFQKLTDKYKCRHTTTYNRTKCLPRKQLDHERFSRDQNFLVITGRYQGLRLFNLFDFPGHGSGLRGYSGNSRVPGVTLKTYKNKHFFDIFISTHLFRMGIKK